MSIVAYTGLPGSGKSYGVVQHVILPALENGREVVTNIPLNLELLRKHYPAARVRQFATTDINDTWFQDQQLAGAVFVIDEVWRLWPSGMKANGVPEGQRSFLAEHRHMVGDDGHTTEIILVTQDLAQIANFARQLVEETYRAIKLTALGQSKKYRVDVYAGAVTGQRPPEGQRLRQFFGQYKEAVYQYYSSHTMGGGQIGTEAKVDKRGNVLRSAPIMVGIPLALCLVVGGVYFASRMFTVEGGLMPTAKQQSIESAPIAQQFQQLKQSAPVGQVKTVEQRPAVELGPQLSSTLRLVGIIEHKGQHFAVVSDTEGRYRRVAADTCQDSFGDPVCEYQGELVSQYSGQITQTALHSRAATKASSYVPAKADF